MVPMTSPCTMSGVEKHLGAWVRDSNDSEHPQREVRVPLLAIGTAL